MSDVSAFLDPLGWADASRSPLAGDASSRRYERLSRPGGHSAILMLDGGSDADIARFLQITALLRNQGFSAPEVLGADPGAGLILMEDLGDTLFAREIHADPTRETPLYEAAVDLLVALQDIDPPAHLTRLTPDVMVEMTEIAFTHYAASPMPGDLRTEMEDIFARPNAPLRLALRDFHAENLIWLPGRKGLQRVGLLDYQDAVAAHPAYDLVSLLRDIRRDVSPGLATAMQARFAGAMGLDLTQFERDAAITSAQRNLRILGVFARLSSAFGKPGYLALMPRVWQRLQGDLSHPDLTSLRAGLDTILPEPTPGFLDTLRPGVRRCPTA